MKKLSYLTMFALAVCIFQACNNSPKDSKETADSVNEMKDTTASEAAGGMAVGEDDAQFATKAAVGGMAEVELGKMALEKSTHADVKSFATMMVNDHGKANEELMSIAKMKNISLPAALDEEHQEISADLSKKTGKDFDKAYVDAMVDGHKKTLDLMEKEANGGQDADLKAFAAKTAPIVKSHLDMIQKIKDSLK